MKCSTVDQGCQLFVVIKSQTARKENSKHTGNLKSRPNPQLCSKLSQRLIKLEKFQSQISCQKSPVSQIWREKKLDWQSCYRSHYVPTRGTIKNELATEDTVKLPLFEYHIQRLGDRRTGNLVATEVNFMKKQPSFSIVSKRQENDCQAEQVQGLHKKCSDMCRCDTECTS